jgi:hypothetical protein
MSRLCQHLDLMSNSQQYSKTIVLPERCIASESGPALANSQTVKFQSNSHAELLSVSLDAQLACRHACVSVYDTASVDEAKSKNGWRGRVSWERVKNMELRKLGLKFASTAGRVRRLQCRSHDTALI